jgi:hypothetical protein
LAERYRPLDESDGGGSGVGLRPAHTLGFSVRTTPDDAVARVAELLDGIDTEWRRYVKVWDGYRGGPDHAVRA